MVAMLGAGYSKTKAVSGRGGFLVEGPHGGGAGSVQGRGGDGLSALALGFMLDLRSRKCRLGGFADGCSESRRELCWL